MAKKWGARMFFIGDKVVYPPHGAGIIEAIEEREVLGSIQSYYVLRICYGGLKVLVPVQKISHNGLRQVSSPEKIEEVFDILKMEDQPWEENWNRRYRTNMEKVKSGNICYVAEVVRSLAARDIYKGLATGEKKMLDYARQILISEIMLVEGWEEQQALSTLEKAISQ